MSVTIADKALFKERVRGWAERLGARVTSVSVRPMFSPPETSTPP